MEKPLFSITCTTCQARLNVLSEELIGELMDCPKCGSFVQVFAPPGWKGPAAPTEHAPPQRSSKPVAQPSSKPTSTLAGAGPHSVIPVPLPPVSDSGPIPPPVSAPPVSAPPVSAPPVSGPPVSGTPVSGPPTPPPPPTDLEDNLPLDESVEDLPRMAVSKAEQKYRRWLIIGGVGLVVLVLAIALIASLGGKGTVAQADPETDTPEVEQPAEEPDIEAPSTEAPTTEQPGAEEPTAQPPGTEEPTTEPPVTEPPVTVEPGPVEPPVTEPPTIEPPATEPPAGPASPGPAEPPPSEPSPPNPLDLTIPAGRPSVPNPLDPTLGEGAEDTEPSAPVGPVRQPLPAVDVKRSLDRPISEITWTGAPLGHVVMFGSKVGGMPVSFDPIAMERTGVSLFDPITMQLQDTTVGAMLQQVLATRRLGLVVDQLGRVTVTHRPAPQLSTITYPVTDLTITNDRAEELASLIKTFVTPAAWGNGQADQPLVKVSGTDIVINHNEAGHLEVIAFCERLRLAKGLPTKSPGGAERFSVKSRTQRGRSLMAQPIRANFLNGCTLLRVVDELARQSGATLLIDRPALAAVGIDDDEPVKVKLWNVRLDQALGSVLSPLGLTSRVIDERTIQITTPGRLAQLPELEFYSLRDHLKRTGQSGDEVADNIRRTIAVQSWIQAGGEGRLYFDENSQRLIVRQPQPIQAQIQIQLGMP